MFRTMVLLTVGLGWSAAIGLAQSTQTEPQLQLIITDGQQPLVGATLELQTTHSPGTPHLAVTDERGQATLPIRTATAYRLKVRYLGYAELVRELEPTSGSQVLELQLRPDSQTLEGITVTGRKALIQRINGKTIVNVDAAITNSGTTVLEVLEKSPGVQVDRNGGISLMNKSNVQVFIDDKPTLLSGADLANYLGGMSSNQVEQIELITSPSAKYDASGNAGIINIKTKKNKQKGFNGNLSTAYGQGVYPKSNNSLALNYRNGRFNTFLNYSSNYNQGYRDLYALREYFNEKKQVESSLDQPTLLRSQNLNNTLKTGLDFYLTDKTTLGLALTGTAITRKGNGDANASWQTVQGRVDSSIATRSNTRWRMMNGGVNLYAKHQFNAQHQLSVDVDRLGYDLNNELLFNNTLQASNGYLEQVQGLIPSTLAITSLKIDHQLSLGQTGKLESGYKHSFIDTDNTANYQVGDGLTWRPDYGKTNRFLYAERINALYSSMEQKWDRLSLQVGLRYEHTNFDAQQLGNVERPDSTFSRRYAGFFPSGYLSYQLDSSNVLTFTAGRRLDRPPFQRLNPFVNVINKYTYERGNPFFQPQYAWNLELSHQYKDKWSTTLLYSVIRNYFSQLFLSEGEDILLYTMGNVGKMHNLGLALALHLAPRPGWSFNGQVLYSYKQFEGFLNSTYASSINQVNFSMNNQIQLGKTYTMELSGFYTTRSRNDIQEIVYDSGQLSLGIARPIFQQKGTLKLSLRDIFHTQLMEGLTDFPDAEEYFIQYWDTRVLNLALSYRFGKPLKSARRNGGAASDEMERVGN